MASVRGPEHIGANPDHENRDTQQKAAERVPDTKIEHTSGKQDDDRGYHDDADRVEHFDADRQRLAQRHESQERRKRSYIRERRVLRVHFAPLIQSRIVRYSGESFSQRTAPPWEGCFEPSVPSLSAVEVGFRRSRLFSGSFRSTTFITLE